MSAASDQLLAEEARRRVRRALALIEQAQNDLCDACATLSSLQHAHPEWKATSAMADRVKAHWYRVRNALEMGPKANKVRLDPMAADAVRARLARAQTAPGEVRT